MSATTAAPVIGIATYRETLHVAPHDFDAAVLPHGYAAAVVRAGGQPVLLAPVPGAAADVLGVVDGLVLSGGGDIDPSRYGAAPVDALLDVRGERDVAELELIEGALARDLPLLAICRGHQLLNVAGGGDLIQHLPDVVGHDGHKQTPGVFADHPVELEPASLLCALFGAQVATKSHHHQAIGRVAPSLTVVGRAPDGTVEAVEGREGRFVVGVQWHPEEGEDLRLFETLVAQARDYREERR